MKKQIDEFGERPSRLVLLDSHAILHRAYHAIPDLATAKGEPTGALYGLVSMVLRITEELKPDYVVACRDMPGKTHRHEIYEEYKGQRQELETDLKVQLDKAPQIFKALGIPVYGLAGFEADDLLGTITKQLSARSDIEIVIASGDKDVLQLVSDRVRVYMIRTGISDLALYDEQAVKERYGFGPELLTDLKGIMGDMSDNIKGVKGVGEGSAKKLIASLGSLSSIYGAIQKQGIETVAEKTGVQKRFVKLVAENETDAVFSKQLATIHSDAPITFVLPQTHWYLVDHVASIAALCDELEFRSLKERVAAITKRKEMDPEGVEVESVRTELEIEPQDVDPHSLEETSVALWLLRSEYTTPSLDDILAYGDTKDFGVAREKIFGDLRKTGRLFDVYEKIEKPLMPIMRRMKEDGIAIDVPYLAKLTKEYSAELTKIAARIYKHAGHEFNINSPKQLGTVIYDELKILPEKQKKTAGGARTTREDELVKLSDMHPIINDILGFRELSKLLGTYVEKMPALVEKDRRIHPTFLQAGSATGRMASENPGVQNIPIKSEYGRRIRDGFIAEKGNVLVSIDYSQIELRVAAGLSGDENLARVFKDGGDVHTAVASQVFNVPPEIVDKEMRRRAKVINFGILYGMGVNALRQNLGARVTREEASKFLSDYFENFSGLSQWIEHIKQSAARTGYTETLYGRRRYFPGFKSALPQLRAQAERMAMNAPIQGTQADIIKLAMIEADALIEKKGWRQKVTLVMQVHDELVYEIDENIAETVAREILKVMEGVVPEGELSGVPIKAEIAIGKNWGEMRKLSK